MDALKKREGDFLSKQLIHEYWKAFTGTSSTWNWYLSPLRYTSNDRWATREQWITAAKQCVDRRTKILFGLEVLLAEGFVEYLPVAMEIVTKWEKEYNAHDPEYYYDILKHFPKDNKLRHRHLSYDSPKELESAPDRRKALISVEDENLCKHIAAEITKIFSASKLDENQVENYALPRMSELGRLCQKYIEPAIMEIAKRFCMEFLQKDRDVAPYYRQLLQDLLAEKIDQRITWIRDDIGWLSWRIGWFDVLTKLRRELWYWNSMFEDWFSDPNNTDLLIWSQYAKDDLLRKRALNVMKKHEYHRLDGAIAWFRMSHVRWPPQ